MPTEESAPTTAPTSQEEGLPRDRRALGSFQQGGSWSSGDAAAPWRGSEDPISFFNLGFHLILWNGPRRSFLPLPCQPGANGCSWKKSQSWAARSPAGSWSQISADAPHRPVIPLLFSHFSFHTISPSPSTLPAPHSQPGLRVAKRRSECLAGVIPHHSWTWISTSDRPYIIPCPWGTALMMDKAPLLCGLERREKKIHKTRLNMFMSEGNKC